MPLVVVSRGAKEQTFPEWQEATDIALLVAACDLSTLHRNISEGCSESDRWRVVYCSRSGFLGPTRLIQKVDASRMPPLATGDAVLR